MILLSLGSNLSSNFGDRFKNLEIATTFIKEKKINLINKSSYYETPSYPNIKKPKFINIVIEIETLLKPIDLMSSLIEIELKLGRKREIKNAPRTCDIDIIDYNGEIYNLEFNNEKLIIPHSMMRSRNFVLYPLFEIAPSWKHPKTNESIETLIQNLSEQDRKSILKIKKN
tara:strand:- start:30 stop:542 length:513 start_codon:yes stop_codon:yes gene_type:complete